MRDRAGDVSPRRRRVLARMQRAYFRAAVRFGMETRAPLQLYNHIRRVRIPRRPR